MNKGIVVASVAAYALGVACVPKAPGKVSAQIAAGSEALARKDYVRAAQEFTAADRALVEEPDERAAIAIKQGLARADVGLLREAVTTAVRVDADPMATIAELHRLDQRLRTVGGDATVAAQIAEGINARASMLMAPHEQTRTVTNIKPLLALGRYPQLSEGTRKRLSALSAKAWRVFDGRASATAHPLVRRAFEGLAAHYSGAALADATAVRDRELAQFARGSKVEVELATGCNTLEADRLRELTRAGVHQVDAKVAVMRCTYKHQRETRMMTEQFVRHIPYQAVETFSETRCAATKVSVSYCINPYTRDGCVGSSDTADSFSCSSVPVTATVTRYRTETGTHQVPRTFTYDTTTLELRWTVAFRGAQTEKTATISSTLENGTGETAAAKAAAAVNASLDEPVQELIAARARELRATGDAALAAGNVDDAELAYLRVILLGHNAGDYFARTYFATDNELRAAFSARRESEPADRVAAVEALPDITDERGDGIIAFARDRFASTFPPALTRTKGLWYNAELGAMAARPRDVGGVEVGGSTSASITLRLGTPVLSRLHGRTRGLWLWDDLSAGGMLGYTATVPDGGERTRGWRGTASYTLAAGARYPGFQLLAGMRETASEFKVGATTGHLLGLSYYGRIGIQLGVPSLSVEAWAPAGGNSTRGAQLFLGIPTPGQHRRDTAAGSISTSYIALRVDDDRFDACASGAGQDCWDVAGLRVIAFGIAFGAAFR
ncbi:MAG: hypothetical protein SFX73_02355 [Kofleriaceae bacterium]|nr:hypothetical protein [Kofleriaceae bacterium]